MILSTLILNKSFNSNESDSENENNQSKTRRFNLDIKRSNPIPAFCQVIDKLTSGGEKSEG